MPNHDDLVAMVPPAVPSAGPVVYVTGVLEVAGALGLLFTATRRVSGIGLALLFVAMLPANVHAAVNSIPLGDAPATPLWFRIPEQILFVATALWAASGTRAGSPRREPARAARSA